MGLYATAYGKPYDVTTTGIYSQASLARLGRNCIHAHAGSVFRNDEILFYDEASILLQYIVEFYICTGYKNTARGKQKSYWLN